MIGPDDIKRYRFTRQEIRACHMAACSKTVAEIAQGLTIEVQSVYNLERRIRVKIAAPNRRVAAKQLQELGFGPQAPHEIG